MNIYLAQQSGTQLYKIGVTKNDPKQRIKQLATGNPFVLELVDTFVTNHDFKMETAIHAEFQSKRMEGEWFLLGDEEIENFQRLCEAKEQVMDSLKKNNPFWK